MNVNQRTIKKPVTLSGIGLHTGNPSTITFQPAPEHYGFRFVRTDLEGNPEVPESRPAINKINSSPAL